MNVALALVLGVLALLLLTAIAVDTYRDKSRELDHAINHELSRDDEQEQP